MGLLMPSSALRALRMSGLIRVEEKVMGGEELNKLRAQGFSWDVWFVRS